MATNAEFRFSVAVLLSTPGKINIVASRMQESMSIYRFTARSCGFHGWIENCSRA
jgi:hypothetical protein